MRFIGLLIALALVTPAHGGQIAPPAAPKVPPLTQTIWPTSGWRTATPQSQGLSDTRLLALDKEIRAGVYGHVDRLVVVRYGHMVVDHRYTRDYRTISRGQIGPIGCGEGCSDPSRMHEFNYYHPNWHPYYQGRDVHTLQSVTKSIAATLVGIALGERQIATLDRPFLDFFKDRDLARSIRVCAAPRCSIC